MKTIELDGKLIKKQGHDYIKKKFNFPNYFPSRVSHARGACFFAPKIFTFGGRYHAKTSLSGDSDGRAFDFGDRSSVASHFLLWPPPFLVGVGNRVEIWDKKRWEESTSFDDMDEIAEHMADLGLNI